MHTPEMVDMRTTTPHMVNSLREMSAGRFDITVYSAGELVSSLEIADALAEGMIDMAWTTGAYYKGAIPVGWLATCSMPPFVWRDWHDFVALYHRLGLDELMREGYAEHGIYFLTTLGESNIYFWSKKPMYTLDDLKGFKVRFYGAQTETMELLGASGVFLPHEETYMAMAMGTLDGSGSSTCIYTGLNLHEVAPYFYGPSWKLPEGMDLMVSMDSWQALPDDLKAMLTEAGKVHAYANHHECIWEEGELCFKQFDKWGVTYIEFGDEDVAKIAEAAVSLFDNFPTEDPRVAKGVEIVKEFAREKGYID